MARIADKRELILERLKDLLEGLPEFKSVWRNKIDVPEKGTEIAIIYDADEVPIEPQSVGRGRPANAPQIVAMTPEIYLLHQGREETLGTEVNTLRQAVIKAVMNDQTLVALCHNGDIRYAGFTTNLSRGRDLNADSGISFTFVYALFPSLL